MLARERARRSHVSREVRVVFGVGVSGGAWVVGVMAIVIALVFVVVVLLRVPLEGVGWDFCWICK